MEQFGTIAVRACAFVMSNPERLRVLAWKPSTSRCRITRSRRSSNSTSLKIENKKLDNSDKVDGGKLS